MGIMDKKMETTKMCPIGYRIEIEYGVYGDLIIYPKPYSIYLGGTVSKLQDVRSSIKPVKKLRILSIMENQMEKSKMKWKL